MTEPLLHVDDVEATAAEAESAESIARQLTQRMSINPDTVAVAALGWFRAQNMHDKYWLNRALQESATKSKQHNAIPCSSWS